MSLRQAAQQALEILNRVMSHGQAVAEAKKVLREALDRKPLTRKEVLGIVDAYEAYKESGLPMFYRDQVYEMIRAAERAHGIGDER